MSERPQEWSREEVVALLQQVDLFEGLPDDDLNAIAAIVGGRTIEPREALFEEGEPGDAFCTVFRGAIEIAKARADGTEEKLAVRRKGDGFGEMALLNEAPRSATARATEPTQLVSVSRDDFQRLLGGDSFALHMMRALSKALRALSVRFANAQSEQDSGGDVPADAFAVSRVIQAGMLPRVAPKVDGHDIAAGTTTEVDGRGASVWDWIQLADGRPHAAEHRRAAGRLSGRASLGYFPGGRSRGGFGDLVGRRPAARLERGARCRRRGRHGSVGPDGCSGRGP